MKRIFNKSVKCIGPLLILALIIGVAFLPEAQAGCFEFTNTCTDASATGEPIYFTITAVNCGILDLVIYVSDPIAGVNEGPISLPAYETWTYNGSYYPAQTPSTNTATATVYLPGNPTPVASFNDSATCVVPDDGGGEGCTPGFWRNHSDVWPIPTDTDFDTTFGRDAFDPDITMLEAVDLRGGGLNALSRHAAAAYLNVVSPVVSYDLTAAEVIAAFQAAFDSGDYNTTKNMFEALNELGCPY